MREEQIQVSIGGDLILKEGDRVYVYDNNMGTISPRKCYGTLRKIVDYPKVSEYYIAFDDGQEYVVSPMSLVFKA